MNMLRQQTHAVAAPAARPRTLAADVVIFLSPVVGPHVASTAALSISSKQGRSGPDQSRNDANMSQHPADLHG
jgi:hypothetical protein